MTSIFPQGEVSQPEPRFRTRPAQLEQQFTVIAVNAWSWSERDRVLRRKCEGQLGILTSISPRGDGPEMTTEMVNQSTGKWSKFDRPAKRRHRTNGEIHQHFPMGGWSNLRVAQGQIGNLPSTPPRVRDVRRTNPTTPAPRKTQRPTARLPRSTAWVSLVSVGGQSPRNPPPDRRAQSNLAPPSQPTDTQPTITASLLWV